VPSNRNDPPAGAWSRTRPETPIGSDPSDTEVEGAGDTGGDGLPAEGGRSVVDVQAIDASKITAAMGRDADRGNRTITSAP
jgi:hypothetical protein